MFEYTLGGKVKQVAEGELRWNGGFTLGLMAPRLLRTR
jgi:hypothetical protein